jgi:hypothetical protein
LFRAGRCVGSKKSINVLVRVDKVEVCLRGEAAVTGMVRTVRPGLLLIQDSTGKPCALMLHPANVTKVHVAGTLLTAHIRTGMVVRMLASVDSGGHGTDPLESLEIVTGNANVSATPVEANHLQTIVGVVTRAKPNYLQIRVEAGKLHRLSFQLAETAVVNVDSTSLAAIVAGAEVKAKGHVYQGFGALTDKTYFVSEVEVLETAPRRQSPNDLATREAAAP